MKKVWRYATHRKILFSDPVESSTVVSSFQERWWQEDHLPPFHHIKDSVESSYFLVKIRIRINFTHELYLVVDLQHAELDLKLDPARSLFCLDLFEQLLRKHRHDAWDSLELERILAMASNEQFNSHFRIIIIYFPTDTCLGKYTFVDSIAKDGPTFSTPSLAIGKQRRVVP